MTAYTTIDAASLDAEATYRLLTGIVVPRPIAWVATRSGDGRINLAPFSTFTFVSSCPAMVGFCIGLRGNEQKDTARNIRLTGEYIIHIADASLLGPLHHSSYDFPPEVSETEMLGLATVPSAVVGVPRLERAPIAMECVLDRAVPFGRGGTEFFVGEVRVFHVREDLLKLGKIDTRQLNPIARLGGPVYGVIGETFAASTLDAASQPAAPVARTK